jgi:hypothetical protein
MHVSRRESFGEDYAGNSFKGGFVRLSISTDNRAGEKSSALARTMNAIWYGH